MTTKIASRAYSDMSELGLHCKRLWLTHPGTQDMCSLTLPALVWALSELVLGRSFDNHIFHQMFVCSNQNHS